MTEQFIFFARISVAPLRHQQKIQRTLSGGNKSVFQNSLRFNGETARRGTGGTEDTWGLQN